MLGCLHELSVGWDRKRREPENSEEHFDGDAPRRVYNYNWGKCGLNSSLGSRKLFQCYNNI